MDNSQSINIVTGSDRKVGEVRGTQQPRMAGDNVRDYRQRVRRV